MMLKVRRFVIALFVIVLLVISICTITAAATSDAIATVSTPVAETVKESKSNPIWTIIAIIFTAIVSSVVSGYLAYKREQKLQTSFNASNYSLMKENQALRNLKKATDTELANAQSRIDDLEDWRKRAIIHQPEIEKIVKLSYAKDAAEIYQKKYSTLDSVQPTYNNYNLFENALYDYNQLREDVQKQVVGINIENLKRKQHLALTDFIATAISHLEQADAKSTGTHQEDSIMLGKVLEWYQTLPDVVKSEIPSNIITSLKMKKATADYHLEVAIKLDDYATTTPSSHGINQILDSVVARSSKLFEKATSWVSSKLIVAKDYLSNPYEECVDEDDDNDNQDE